MAIEKIVIFHHDMRGAAVTWSEVGEIVRCKDCEHRAKKDGQCPLMATGDPYYDTWPQDDFFCAYGERREDG